MLSVDPSQTKILVIDEIDTFESSQYGFLAFTKAVLSSKSNTILIGIANSVDLPFKKKSSAIAMRDTQLLFQPYSDSQISTIIEEKLNKKLPHFPLHLKQNAGIKQVFFNLLDESKAMDLIAKKVAKLNGDIRVAFDIIKSAFVELFNRVKYQQQE